MLPPSYEESTSENNVFNISGQGQHQQQMNYPTATTITTSTTTDSHRINMFTETGTVDNTNLVLMGPVIIRTISCPSRNEDIELEPPPSYEDAIKHNAS